MLKYFSNFNNNNEIRLQALIDCSWGFGNNGCDGGEDFRSYQWIMKHGGLPTEDDYGGYLGQVSRSDQIDENIVCDRCYNLLYKMEKHLNFSFQDGYCHIDNVTMTAKITGYVNVTPRSVDALKIAIAKHGPISIAIDASHKTFSFYSHGVYYDQACGEFAYGIFVDL